MLFCGDLVPRHLEYIPAWPDKRDSVFGCGACEVGVLAEEAVSGINGVRPGLFGDTDDFLNRQVGANGVSDFTNLIGLVRFESVSRLTVLVGKNSDGFRAELERGTKCSNSDLAAIRNENFCEQCSPSV